VTHLDAILPTVGDPDAAEFWAALERGELLVSVCAACGKRWLPPLATCPRCVSRDIGNEPAPATGRLYSWSVIHMAVDPVFAAETPYVVGLVQLALGGEGDGARLYGRIVDIDHDDLRDGLELQVGVTRVQTDSASRQPSRAMWYFTVPPS
jgi:uncharacterized OB-fold protein